MEPTADDSRNAEHGGEVRPGSASGQAPVEGARVPEEVAGAAVPEEVAEPKVQRHGILRDPTEAQVEAHVCGGHSMFEPWCVDCCRGRTQE